MTLYEISFIKSRVNLLLIRELIPNLSLEEDKSSIFFNSQDQSISIYFNKTVVILRYAKTVMSNTVTVMKPNTGTTKLALYHLDLITRRISKIKNLSA